MEHADTLINIAAILGSCVSVYLGIRVDLVKLHAKYDRHEEVIGRIDERLNQVSTRLHGHLEAIYLHNSTMNRRSTDN